LIDATVAASFVTNPEGFAVADKVGFALAPNAGLGKNANWLWAWNLANSRRFEEGRRCGKKCHRLGQPARTNIKLVARRGDGRTFRPARELRSIKTLNI